MEDWEQDLQAVVRGHTPSFEAFNTFNEPPCFASSRIELGDLHFLTFPVISETKTVLGELEEQLQNQELFVPQTTLSPSSIFVSGEERGEPEEKKVQESQRQRPAGAASPVASSTASPPPTKPRKRRDSQQKRVVREVTAEGLTLIDTWAWRKYGQKPIKGSPYPRSYYRCSSLKGCPARRQVEQSSSDPQMLVVTYSAEHNHPEPVKRSSLAGSIRSKNRLISNLSQSRTAALSPKNSIKNEPTKQESGGEEDNEDQAAKGNDDCKNFVMSDMIFPDDLFPDLEELGGLSSEWSLNFGA